MLNENEILTASSAIREFRVALSNLFLYEASNDMVGQSLERFLNVLEQLLANYDPVTIGLSEGRMVVEGSALNERVTGSTNMIRDLFQSHEIHSITLGRGLTTDELKAFADKIRPRALPPGTTLVQALKAEPLPHLQVNQKMFVAVKEGEIVGASGAGGEDTNFNEALEALQYFLQVFSRVKPDANKKEIAQKLSENLGGWLPENSSEGLSAPGTGSGTGSGGDAGLGQLLTVFQQMRSLLAKIPAPAGMENQQQDLDEMVRKMASSLMSQKTGGASAPSSSNVPESDGSQAVLFETDPVLTALESGFLAPLENPFQEDAVARCIQTLQEQSRMDSMDSLWEGLWKNLDNPDENIQSLGLRHLGRWNWETLPRHLQLDALRRCGAFLDQIPKPAPSQAALTLARAWLTQEWKNPDWPAFNELVACIESLSVKRLPHLSAQSSAAKKTMESLFPGSSLEELWKRYAKGGFDAHGPAELWTALGTYGCAYLMPKALAEGADDKHRGLALAALERIIFTGRPVLEEWMESKPKSAGWAPFLTLFHQITMNAGVAKKLTEVWHQMTPAERLSALRGAARWNRREFRVQAFQFILEGLHGEAVEALQLLPNIAQPGDSREVIQAVEKRFYKDKNEKDEFQVEACRSLGRLQDSLAVKPLQEWVQTQGILSKLLERSHAVRCAALLALAEFRSQQVRNFLEKCADSGDKSLRTTAHEALKISAANLAAAPAFEAESMGTSTPVEDLIE